MEFQARFPSVTAREATFADDGDKIMVLFRDGVPLEILATSVFHAVYAPVGPVPEAAAPKRKYAKRSQAVLAILRKKPMSSGELIKQMKCNSSIVYTTTHVMKEKGLIEGKLSDEDGTRRWCQKELI